jgi:Protein of unknown function (DUF4199)
MSMKKTVLTFGVISGLVSSAMMLATLPLLDRIGFGRAEILGYTGIVLSFLLVFFGVRSYREASGGTLTFGRALTVGMLITLISCVFYVVTWEIIYFTLAPDFGEKYAAYTMERLKTSGANAQTIDAHMKQIEQFKRLNANPWTNAAIALVEPLPIGLLVTLVSAAVLRKKRL